MTCSTSRLASAIAIAALSGATFLATPASAARRHHHHRLVCGAGTHRAHNQCVPDPPSTPGSGSAFVGCFATNNPALITGQFGDANHPAGTVTITVFCRHLVSSEVLAFSSPSLAAACKGVASIPNVTTDTGGNATVQAVGGDASHACTPGNITIDATETTAPSRTFHIGVTLTT